MARKKTTKKGQRRTGKKSQSSQPKTSKKDLMTFMATMKSKSVNRSSDSKDSHRR